MGYGLTALFIFYSLRHVCYVLSGEVLVYKVSFIWHLTHALLSLLLLANATAMVVKWTNWLAG
jgi:hypothetical protein